MKDLVATYAGARFGKAAVAEVSAPTRAGLRRFVSGYFPSALSERLRQIRDAIEESIREEERLRGKARKATSYAKHKVTTVPSMGPGGLAWDVIRAAIPGLSPHASETDGIEKTAQSPESDSRWYPAIHLGAGAAGAGLGAAQALRGLTEAGRLTAAKRLFSAAAVQRELAPKELLERIATMAGRPTGKGLMLTVPEVEGAIAAARGKPAISRLRQLPGQLGRLYARIRGSAPIPAPAPPLAQGVATALAAKQELGRRAVSHLRSVKIPWKGKAAIGAAALTLPFFLYNFWKNRAVRAKGGPEALRAAQKAEHWLDRSEKIRKWRGQQLSQLELAPTSAEYRLLPFRG